MLIFVHVAVVTSLRAISADWHREPKALPARFEGQTSNGSSKMGHGVQGLPGVRRRVHEPAAGQHGGIHRGQLGRQLGRSAHPVRLYCVLVWFPLVLALGAFLSLALFARLAAWRAGLACRLAAFATCCLP